MKHLLLLAFLPFLQTVLASPEDLWLELPLDHFNLFDNRTWKMRYFVNDEFFESGNPIFIEVGGEWTIDGSALEQGQFYQLAKKHKGMLVETEHRYYGKSLPFGTNFSTDNLRFLQMEQALEDLAYFIDFFKGSTAGANSSIVVVHGCSYPGMLVTWMRLRFPHKVDISYASSAPLGVGLDYPEFFQTVADTYFNVSSRCFNTIKQGFNETIELFKTKQGRKDVREALRGWDCGDVDEMNMKEIHGHMIAIMNVMHDPAQYEQLACLIMSMDTDELRPFERLAKFLVAKSNDVANCQEGEDPTGEEERNGIAWEYQTCTEMGTFQTLDIKDAKNPFAAEYTLEESAEECGKTLGREITPEILVAGTERVTRRYGGLKPRVTKVVTIQGTHDPWRHLSVFEDYTPDAPVFVVEGSHCIDINEPSEDDTEELIAVRKKIRDLISKWIKQIA